MNIVHRALLQKREYLSLRNPLSVVRCAKLARPHDPAKVFDKCASHRRVDLQALVRLPYRERRQNFSPVEHASKDSWGERRLGPSRRRAEAPGVGVRRRCLSLPRFWIVRARTKDGRLLGPLNQAGKVQTGDRARTRQVFPPAPSDYLRYHPDDRRRIAAECED